jgi:hypothetical protein
MSLVLSYLYIAEYVLVYAVIRLLVKREPLAVLILAVVLLVNFYGPMNIVTDRGNVGPLRFGLGWMLIFLAARAEIQPRRGRFLLAGERALVGLASLWSVEAFVNMAAAHLAIRAHERLGGRPWLRCNIAKLARD